MSREQIFYDDVHPGDTLPTLTVTPDERQLFFFSAATYNGHRIHYDKDWARTVEGYDDVIVQGPLQAALLARAVTDWIGGLGRLVEYSVQNRAVALAGEELTFGGSVTGKRLVRQRRPGRPGHRRATRRHVLMPGTATVALPLRGDQPMTGLRGEAAIIGIAELPAERKQTRPPSFTLDQYALLAKMVVDDAGVDAAVVNGLVCHGLAESDMFAPATLSEYLGLPVNFGERVDLGGATSAGMVWRAAAAVELGLCDAVLAVVPGSAVLPTSTRQPPAPAPGGTARRATSTAHRRPSSKSRTATSARTDPTRRSRSGTPRFSVTTQQLWRRSRSTSVRMRARIPARCFTASPSPSTTFWPAR